MKNFMSVGNVDENFWDKNGLRTVIIIEYVENNWYPRSHGRVWLSICVCIYIYIYQVFSGKNLFIY
jgi:hypothetical protein